MTNCYICQKEITKDNETEEHIILNAIGGTLKPKTLICKQCNSQLGNEIDSELANQLNFISNMLNIERDRKPVPNIELKSITTGIPILLRPGGKPVMKIPQVNEDNKKNIFIKVPNIKQAKKVLNGLKRKRTKIDISKALSEFTTEKRYLDEEYRLNIVIGGDKAFRSICKMAVNLYMLKDGSRKYIKHLIPYILGNEESNCVQYYYDNPNIISKTNNEVLHSIIINGNKEEKLLSAYIELFNFYKFVVLFNDKYDGNNINISYYFDVLQRKEIIKSNEYNLSKHEINELINNSNTPSKKIIAEVNKILHFSHEKQASEHIDILLQKALDNSLNKYSENEIYTEEMGDKFIDEIMKQITPWLANKLNHKKK